MMPSRDQHLTQRSDSGVSVIAEMLNCLLVFEVDVLVRELFEAKRRLC